MNERLIRLLRIAKHKGVNVIFSQDKDINLEKLKEKNIDGFSVVFSLEEFEFMLNNSKPNELIILDDKLKLSEENE